MMTINHTHTHRGRDRHIPQRKAFKMWMIYHNEIEPKTTNKREKESVVRVYKINDIFILHSELKRIFNGNVMLCYC